MRINKQILILSVLLPMSIEANDSVTA